MDKLLMLFCFLLFSNIADASDPTKPFLAKKKTEKIKQNTVNMTQPLTAIFTRNNQRTAMIEGRIYRSGEFYHGKKILSIEQDKVLLVSGEERSQLTLIPNIKSPSNIKSK